MAITPNIKVTAGLNSLVIEITDLEYDGGLSSSGKSKIVATTGGFMAVEGGYSLGINLVRPVERAPK